MTAVNNFDILTNILDFEKWKECDFFLILWGILTALTLANFKDQVMSLSLEIYWLLTLCNVVLLMLLQF